MKNSILCCSFSLSWLSPTQVLTQLPLVLWHRKGQNQPHYLFFSSQIKVKNTLDTAFLPPRLEFLQDEFMCSCPAKDLTTWSKRSTRVDKNSLLIIVNKGWQGLGLLPKYKAVKHNLNWRLVLAQKQIDADDPRVWDGDWSVSGRI